MSILRHKQKLLPLGNPQGGGKGGGGGGSAPSPDPNIGLAQKKMADIQEEYLNNWRTEVWPAMKEQTLKQEARADEQFAIDKEIQAIQLDSSKKNLAEYDRNAINREAIYKEAETYNTAENKERLAAEAIGDVKTAFGIQAQDLERRNQSFGINPTSGRSVGAIYANSVMQAATESAAATRARDAAVQLGWAKKMDAAALAQGSFGNQATSTGLALNAGGQALNAGQTTMGNLGAMNSAMGNTFGQMTSGWNSVGNLGVQNYGIQSQNYQADQNRIAQQNAGSSAGWGSLAGSVIGAVGNYYSMGALGAAKAGAGK